MDENGIVGSIEELAKHFGRATRTVYRWISAGMPMLADGRFDVFAVTAWRKRKKGAGAIIPQGQEGIGGDQVPVGPIFSGDDKDAWDKENKKWQARTREMEFRKRQGELIELGSVEDMFISRILGVKTVAVESRAATSTELIHCRSDREMSEVTRKFIPRALAQFARPLPESMSSIRRQITRSSAMRSGSTSRIAGLPAWQ